MRTLTLNDLLHHPVHFPALGFGVGLSPWAPGTLGTLIAIPLYWLAMHYAMPFYAVIVLIASVVGIYICDVTAKTWARTITGASYGMKSPVLV